MVCVQIGLVDVLREEYGITPGGVLGHSAGEIACGYGDGCFTREQTVLVAYHRGRMCPEHNISGGLMAAVGLGADEAEARLAKHGKSSCVVGCDNSPNSVTLSGNAFLGAFTHIHALYGNFSHLSQNQAQSLCHISCQFYHAESTARCFVSLSCQIANMSFTGPVSQSNCEGNLYRPRGGH